MKPLVLLSGGLDSAVALASTLVRVGKEASEGREAASVKTLCFDYGQHHRWECRYAYKQALHYGTLHREVHISRAIFGDAGVMEAMVETPKSAADAMIPFRNGILFAIAVGMAEQMGCDQVVVATHGQDSGFYDTQLEFVDGFGKAVLTGTNNKVTLKYPIQNMVKSQIIQAGSELGVPFELTRSCYVSERVCGECLACVIRAEAFATTGLNDPAA